VPPGSTADIVLPLALLGASHVSSVRESAVVVWSDGKYVAPIDTAGFLGFSHESYPYAALAFKVGSGSYAFSATWMSA
jgi:hypothetical protein